MLKNEQQLAGARKKLRALREALELETDTDGRRSLEYLITDVQQEISEYEAVRDGAVRTFAIRSLDDLGPALVKVRIASGKTQRELAGELEVSEQQVNKDESKEYETAGVAKMADVLDVLDYELVGEVRPKTEMSAVDSPMEQSIADASSVHLTGIYVLTHSDLGGATTLTYAGRAGAVRAQEAVITTPYGFGGRFFLGASCMQGPWKVERTVPHHYNDTANVIKPLGREAENAH